MSTRFLLQVVDGYNRGERVPLPPGESWVGRGSECAVLLASDGVSRKHARLVVSQDGVEVEDAGSKNGTLLNGCRVERAAARAGDLLRFGDVTVAVRAAEVERHGSTLALDPDAAEAAAPLSPQVELWGDSPPMRTLLAQVERVARVASPVLVRGETGTGKELVARAIHALSPRRRAPFVPLNCAALEGPLLESELFGHERGAFTGATARKLGLVEVAGGGTLFLDEVAELPPASQAKLLRLLEDGELRRVGGTEALRARCRVVAATHRDLEGLAASGGLREDLLYRLRVVELNVPPLRDRGDDLALLTDRLLERLQAEVGRRVVLTPAARAALAAHDWPGNVRELKNALERAVILAPRAEVEPGDLLLGGRAAAAGEEAGEFPTLAELERRHVERALERTGGARAEAASLLGIDRKTLYRRLKQLGIEP